MKKSGLIAVLMVSILSFGWHCGYEKSPPNELLGVWETTAQRYNDRFFEIDTDTITFGTGGENFETYTIKKVKKIVSQEDGGILLTIYYEIEEGDVYTFAFHYSPARGGEIRLKNQTDMIWTKEQGG
jgi:hypothetical protein